MEIKIDVPAGKKAEWVNGVLTLIDETPEDNRPVTERVKTFEDAARELGYSHPFVDSYNGYVAAISPEVPEDKDVVAYLKLRIIVAALNEGWKPKFTEDEWRYYPWFWLYTQDEINDMKCEEKQKRNLQLRKIGHYAGFACAYTHYVPSHAPANLGSRLCLKNSELASYCGTQFIEIWADYVLNANETEKSE